MKRTVTNLFLVSAIIFVLPSVVFGLYSKKSAVVQLTTSNFEHRVVDSDGVWIIEFYAPWCGHCQQLAPEYEKAAKALKGIINIGSVDCDVEKSLCSKYSVSGFPTLKVFGENKKNPDPYNGQRNAAGIVSAAQDAAQQIVTKRLGGKSSGKSSGKDGSVVELSDSNFKKLVLESEDMWLIEFFAPWCGHCKNLEPHWKKAAGELSGKVKLGAVDATMYPALAQQYGVKGYPTIKYFPQGIKKGDPEEYDGGRTASDIVTWANDHLEVQIAAPEVVEAISNNVFKENCQEKPLCVISFLPHILDCNAKCRSAYIAILKEAGEKFKKQGWGWLWVEGMVQSDLESSLDVGGFGYPAMSVLSVKKMKFSTLTGSFGKEGINEFLRDLSYGKGRTNTVKGAKLPELSSLDKWDGKDGKMPVEDDVDLSDVELEDLGKDEL